MNQLLEAPPPLPPPALWQVLLLESPGAWLVAGGLSLLAVVLFLKLRGTRARIAASALMLVAIAVAVAQAVVRTDHETVQSRTREAVLAAAHADARSLTELLSPAFQARYYAAPSGIDRQETIRRCQNFFGQSPIEIHISQVDVSITNNRFGRSQVLLSGRGDLTAGYPALSWWLLEWERTEAGWQVSAAQPYSMQGMRNPGGQ